MMPSPEQVLHVSVTLSLAMTGAAMLLVFARLAKGPTLPDRVVALDMVGMISVGFIAVYGILAEQPILLDAATVVALVSFVGTVAFARYVERRGRDE